MIPATVPWVLAQSGEWSSNTGHTDTANPTAPIR